MRVDRRAALILPQRAVFLLDQAEFAVRLAVAVGIYLPLELSVPIFAGGLIAWLAAGKPGSGAGLLLAAGLITGEALVGIVLAVPIVLTGNPEVLSVGRLPFGTLLGLATIAAVAIWLWRAETDANNL